MLVLRTLLWMVIGVGIGYGIKLLVAFLWPSTHLPAGLFECSGAVVGGVLAWLILSHEDNRIIYEKRSRVRIWKMVLIVIGLAITADGGGYIGALAASVMPLPKSWTGPYLAVLATLWAAVEIFSKKENADSSNSANKISV